MIFLRKIIPGAADDSYGVEVAKLAGLPNSVIARAREILSQLEQEGTPAPAKSAAPAPEDDQMSMEMLGYAQVAQTLSAINLDVLTPIEAMNQLYKLKKMLG